MRRERHGEEIQPHEKFNIQELYRFLLESFTFFEKYPISPYLVANKLEKRYAGGWNNKQLLTEMLRLSDEGKLTKTGTTGFYLTPPLKEDLEKPIGGEAFNPYRIPQEDKGEIE